MVYLAYELEQMSPLSEPRFPYQRRGYDNITPVRRSLQKSKDILEVTTHSVRHEIKRWVRPESVAVLKSSPHILLDSSHQGLVSRSLPIESEWACDCFNQ